MKQEQRCQQKAVLAVQDLLHAALILLGLVVKKKMEVVVEVGAEAVVQVEAWNCRLQPYLQHASGVFVRSALGDLSERAVLTQQCRTVYPLWYCKTRCAKVEVEEPGKGWKWRACNDPTQLSNSLSTVARCNNLLDLNQEKKSPYRYPWSECKDLWHQWPRGLALLQTTHGPLRQSELLVARVHELIQQEPCHFYRPK